MRRDQVGNQVPDGNDDRNEGRYEDPCSAGIGEMSGIPTDCHQLLSRVGLALIKLQTRRLVTFDRF